MNFAENGLLRAGIESGTGAYLTLSDKTVKKNVKPLGPVLDRVCRLKAVKFHYTGMDDRRPKQKGFIAQEVEVLFPEIVKEFPNGKKGLVYDDFSVLAIQAIQELKAEEDDLDARLRKIEKKLSL